MDLSQAIARTRLTLMENPEAFDAIIVGAGAAGGMAAVLLAESGLRTLVLDAGWVSPFWKRPITRAANATVRTLANPEALRYVPSRLAWKGRQILKKFGALRQPIQSTCYAWEGLPNGFVDDKDSPYETPPDHPFKWMRARTIGGRMVVPSHGKQYLRHGPADFSPGDMLSPAWPVQPGELDQWYNEVEHRIALHGQKNGSEWIPDSHLTHPLTPDRAQSKLIETLTERWSGAQPMLGRFANPMPGMAQAAATGNLYCRKGAVACKVETKDGTTTGVTFHDQASGRRITAHAPKVFLCASSLETTRLLLLSRTDNFLAREDDAIDPLGRYIMDHVSVKAEGMMPSWGLEDQDFNLGNCVYLPRFERRDGAASTRGYGMRVYQTPGPGGRSYFTAVSDAEMYPRADNRVTLSKRTDKWGVPILHIDCTHGEAEKAMAQDQIEAVLELADLVGADLQTRDLEASTPGAAIHEVGGARMGHDRASSVVDTNNQCWDAEGLYVTDGACFPSIGIQNPTLTILALTARACHHAVQNAAQAAGSAQQMSATA